MIFFSDDQLTNDDDAFADELAQALEKITIEIEQRPVTFTTAVTQQPSTSKGVVRKITDFFEKKIKDNQIQFAKSTKTTKNDDFTFEGFTYTPEMLAQKVSTISFHLIFTTIRNCCLFI